MDSEPCKCPLCEQELLLGSTFCVACGYDSSDLESRKIAAVQEADGRIRRAKSLGRFFRRMFWGQQMS